MKITKMSFFTQTIYFISFALVPVDAFTFSNFYLEEEIAFARNVISISCGHRMGICLFGSFDARRWQQQRTSGEGRQHFKF
jgi:hypothetical protein